MVIGDQHYAPVNTEHVVILFEEPVRPYKEIGLVSSLGGWFTSDGDITTRCRWLRLNSGRCRDRPGGSMGLLAISKDWWRSDQKHRLTWLLTARAGTDSGDKTPLCSMVHSCSETPTGASSWRSLGSEHYLMKCWCDKSSSRSVPCPLQSAAADPQFPLPRSVSSRVWGAQGAAPRLHVRQ